MPVSLYWGRTPGKEDDTMKAAVLERENPTWLRKCLMIIFLGRHNFVQFSNAVSLRHMADEHGTDEIIVLQGARSGETLRCVGATFGSSRRCCCIAEGGRKRRVPEWRGLYACHRECACLLGLLGVKAYV